MKINIWELETHFQKYCTFETFDCSIFHRFRYPLPLVFQKQCKTRPSNIQGIGDGVFETTWIGKRKLWNHPDSRKITKKKKKKQPAADMWAPRNTLLSYLMVPFQGLGPSVRGILILLTGMTISGITNSGLETPLFRVDTGCWAPASEPDFCDLAGFSIFTFGGLPPFFDSLFFAIEPFSGMSFASWESWFDVFFEWVAPFPAANFLSCLETFCSSGIAAEVSGSNLACIDAIAVFCLIALLRTIGSKKQLNKI